MTKLVVWCIGLVLAPVVVVPVAIVYLAWLALVGAALLVALMLRLAGLAVGTGWAGAAIGIDAYRRRVRA